MKNSKILLIICILLSILPRGNLLSQCGNVSAEIISIPVECYQYGKYFHPRSYDIHFTNALYGYYYDMNIEKINGALIFSYGPEFYMPSAQNEKFLWDPLEKRYICLSSSASMSVYFEIDEDDLHPANLATLRFSWRCLYRENGIWRWSNWDSFDFVVRPEQPTITGSTPVCYSGTKTYTVYNIPEDVSSLSWDLCSDLLQTGSGSNYINVKARYPTSSIAGWLRPKYNMVCGTSYTLNCQNKDLWIGPPNPNADPTVQITGGYGGYPSPFPCIYTYYTRYGVSLNKSIPGTTQGYDWSGLVQSLSEYGTGATFIPMNPGSPYYGSGYIQVVGINQCGAGFIPLSRGYGPCGGFMALPNPADGYVDIDTDPERFDPSKLSLNTECLLYICDNMGVARYSAQFKDFPFRINTSSWQEGVYFVQMRFNDEQYSLPVTIKH